MSKRRFQRVLLQTLSEIESASVAPVTAFELFLRTREKLPADYDRSVLEQDLTMLDRLHQLSERDQRREYFRKGWFKHLMRLEWRERVQFLSTTYNPWNSLIATYREV